MVSRVAAIFLVLLLFLGGCPFEKKKPVAPPQEDTSAPVVPGNPITPYIEDVKPKQLKLSEPYSCGDAAVAIKLGVALGEGYSVSKSPPAIGKTANALQCFVREDNIAVLTFSILGLTDEDTALDALEDEKKQYQQQIFNYNVEESAIGSSGYLFEQPVKDGSLYRLIFIDDSNKKVMVVIKSGAPVDRNLVDRVGQALAELI